MGRWKPKREEHLRNNYEQVIKYFNKGLGCQLGSIGYLSRFRKPLYLDTVAALECKSGGARRGQAKFLWGQLQTKSAIKISLVHYDSLQCSQYNSRLFSFLRN